METLQVRPQFISLTDQLEVCIHGWPVEIAICQQCYWENEVARLAANPIIDTGDARTWEENEILKLVPRNPD
jgi:hypothetical protein